DDLHRFLDGKPVRARPVGVVERAVKWARRRPALAAVVLALVVLSAAVGAGVWLEHRRSSLQAATRQTIENAINNAYELGRAERWQDAKRGLADAEGQLDAADSDELRGRLARAKTEVQFAEQLDTI